MITKEEFVELIDWHYKQDTEVDRLCTVFPNFFELEVVDNSFKLVDMVWKICFDTEGHNWISWWLYDCKTSSGKCERTYEDNGKIVSVETVDELWNLVKPCRK